MELTDLRKLAWPLGTLALCLGLGGAAITYGLTGAKQTAQQLQTVSQQRKQAEAKLRQANAEELEIRDKAALYASLEKRGAVGEEKRLDWIDLLRSTTERHRLFKLDYEMLPRQRLQALPSGAFFASTMNLSLPLLHEGDLLRLLGTLKAEANAVVVPVQCQLARVAPAQRDAAALAPNLKADCHLAWVMIDPGAK